MACGNTTRETCGDVLYATCIDYEGNLGTNSNITDSCVTIEETTEDLYTITDAIIADLSTANLGQRCITYALEGGLIKPKAVFEALEAKICDLDEMFQNFNNLENLDISGWSVDFGCLENKCLQPITTLGDFAQSVATAICDGIIPPAFANQPRIASGVIMGNNMVLTRDDASTVTVDVSTLIDDTNLARIESVSLSTNNLILTRGDSSTLSVDLSPFLDDTNLSRIEGASVSGNNLILTRGDSSTITADLSAFLDDTNLSRIEGASVSGSNLILTRGDASTISVDLSAFLDDTNAARIVSGEVVGTNLRLTRDDATTFDVDVTSLVGGGGGGITSVVAGDNITIDNTDPANPIINNPEITGSFTGNVTINASTGANAAAVTLAETTATVNYTQKGNLVTINGNVAIGGFSLPSSQYVICEIVLTPTTPPFTSTNSGVNPLATNSPMNVTRNRHVNSQATINPQTGVVVVDYFDIPTVDTSGAAANVVLNRIHFSGSFTL